jgi:phospholipase C
MNKKAFAQPFPGAAGKPYGGPTEPNRALLDQRHPRPGRRRGRADPLHERDPRRGCRNADLDDHARAARHRGVTWKVYGWPDANYGDNVLTYFRNYQVNPVLAANAFTPTFPGDVRGRLRRGDPAAGLLDPRPARAERAPARVGHLRGVAAAQILDALTSNPEVWAKTALFITYDENGGFFDRMPPPRTRPCLRCPSRRSPTRAFSRAIARRTHPTPATRASPLSRAIPCRRRRRRCRSKSPASLAGRAA